jgi:hypothetical protein
MSTAHEIEAAIRLLSAPEREKLINDLPALLPELDGDLAWNQIIRDTHSRPGLTELLDKIATGHKKNPAEFPEINDKDFDLHS